MSEDRPLRRRNCVDGCEVFRIISKQIRWTNDPRKTNAQLRTTALQKMNRQQNCPSRDRRGHCPLIGLKHFCWGSWLDLPTNRRELGTCLQRDATRGGYDYEGTRPYILRQVATVEEAVPAVVIAEEQAVEAEFVAFDGPHGVELEAQEVEVFGEVELLEEVADEQNGEVFEEVEEDFQVEFEEELEAEAEIPSEEFELVEFEKNEKSDENAEKNENSKTLNVWHEQSCRNILAEWREAYPVHQVASDRFETASMASLPSSNGSNYSLPESTVGRKFRWEVADFWSNFTDHDDPNAPVWWEFDEESDVSDYFDEQRL